VASTSPPVQIRKGRNFSAAQRKAAADRMHKMWAAKRKATAAS
jgi:hypothetical protein